MKLSRRLLTFPAGGSMMSTTSRKLVTHIIFPLLSLYHTDAGAVLSDRPGAVFLLSLPDYCFFIFIEKQ